MNKYGQYCPVARAVEILGDRWTLLIVRDVLYGTHHFNELERGLPGIPRALLAERLRRLQQVGVLDRRVGSDGRQVSYQLTEAGKELKQVIDVLMQWGAKWAFGEPEPAELDPVLLLWWMHDRVCSEQLPRRRIVVQFAFRGAQKRNFWLVLRPGDTSVCLKHPGFDSDVLVTADLAAFYQVWLGRITLADAMRDQRVELDGTPALIRGFPRWFALGPSAAVVREVADRQRFTRNRSEGR
ncbi:MAG TPA: helix-turn-helix domain-containing protein [Anaerolineae bacterium]|nr:helix-turn-helix domain-containing protein [Anaerolineae bacterium]